MSDDFRSSPAPHGGHPSPSSVAYAGLAVSVRELLRIEFVITITNFFISRTRRHRLEDIDSIGSMGHPSPVQIFCWIRIWDKEMAKECS
jgi:hypothetical protein